MLHHSIHGEVGYNDLLHKVCDIALKRVDPLLKPERLAPAAGAGARDATLVRPNTASAEGELRSQGEVIGSGGGQHQSLKSRKAIFAFAASESSFSPVSKPVGRPSAAPPITQPKSPWRRVRRVDLSVSKRLFLYERDGSQCTFTDPQTGRMPEQ